MFDKYLHEIKGKPFIIAFVLLSIIGCVGYSYHFQILYSVDDEPIQTGYLYYYSVKNWHLIFDVNHKMNFIYATPRWLSIYIADIFSDLTMAKNALLFLNIVVTAWLITFFVRCGLAIKSIFWTLLISTLILVNPSLQEHYTFIVAIIRLTSIILLLPLALAVITTNKLKNIILSIFVLYLCASVYQLSLIQYVGATVMLSVAYLINNKDQELKPLIFNLCKEKLIPSLIVFFTTFAIYSGVTKILLRNLKWQDRFQYATHIDKSSFDNFGNHVHQVLDFIIFNYYPADLRYGHRIFAILFISMLISLFLIFRKQEITKKITLIGSVFLIVCLSPIILNFSNIIALSAKTDWNYWLMILRVMVPNSLIMAMLVYIVYAGFSKFKYLNVIASVLLFVFTLQIVNRTVSKSYNQLIANQAKVQRYNRLYNDILSFARANQMRHKFKVFFITSLDKFKIPGVKQSKQYLHHDQTYEYKTRMNRTPMLFLERLGLDTDIQAMTDTEKNSTKVQQTCQKLVKDSDMSKWPFYNSMKLIDGVIYVKMTDDKKSDVCWLSANEWSTIPLKSIFK